jgi:hypothetical protein
MAHVHGKGGPLKSTTRSGLRISSGFYPARGDATTKISLNLREPPRATIQVWAESSGA